MKEDNTSNNNQPLSLDETIFKEIVNSLYMALPASVAANIVIGISLVTILWRVIDTTLLLSWLFVLVSLSLCRYILYKLYLKSNKTATELQYWDRLFYMFLILTGLTWSCVSIMLLPESGTVDHYLPALILIGISAGAVTSLGFRMLYITIYFMLLLVPLFLSEILIGTFLSYIVAFLIVVFIFLALTNAKRISNTLKENITLNYLSAAQNQALIESKNTAIKANTVKDHFISMISHELRTPLNAILGYAQLLKMSDVSASNEEHDDQAQGIIDSGKHLLSLIEELLDLSEIQADQLKVTVEDVSLKSALVESLTILHPVASAYQDDIVDEIENKYLVRADHKRLKQIFINLISNAIKYNHFQGKIIISARVMGNGFVRISVTDDGNGLTQEQQNNLFQAFKRFNTKKEGIGLGLFITKKLVELMGGKIGVTSEIDKGSTFWFELALSEQTTA